MQLQEKTGRASAPCTDVKIVLLPHVVVGANAGAGLLLPSFVMLKSEGQEARHWFAGSVEKLASRQRSRLSGKQDQRLPVKRQKLSRVIWSSEVRRSTRVQPFHTHAIFTRRVDTRLQVRGNILGRKRPCNAR